MHQAKSHGEITATKIVQLNVAENNVFRFVRLKTKQLSSIKYVG